MKDFSSVSVLVVGDVMLDRHLYGSVSRVSPEAPVPVVELRGEHCSLGGAGNVGASLAALGCKTTLCGVTGKDPDAARLNDCLDGAGKLVLEFVRDDSVRTISKTRIVASRHQQIVRLDQDGCPIAFGQMAPALWRRIEPLVAEHDAVVLADYDKGTVTDKLAQDVVKACRRRGIPCLVDPKKRDFSVYAGATVLTPNVLETERATGRILNDEAAICTVAADLRERLTLDLMLVTRGTDGMTLASATGTRTFCAVRRAVADVTGAGDTVVATLAAAFATGMDPESGCQLASIAAGLAVAQPGTYVVSHTELAQAWKGLSPKLLSWDAARAKVQEAQRNGRRVVFTNGCFDILHAGHLRSLELARRTGDMLVVGLNSDESVRMNKGNSRPIIAEEHRASMLAGLECVDAVVLFDDVAPEALVRHLLPNVLVKGQDYADRPIAGADFVRAHGGEIVLLPLVEGLSTTGIVRTMSGAGTR